MHHARLDFLRRQVEGLQEEIDDDTAYPGAEEEVLTTAARLFREPTAQEAELLDQEDYFRRAFARLRLDPGPLAPETLPEAARGLREGVLAIAAEGEFVEILVAMLAAEWMYLTWCEEAHARGPRREAPADWIRLHVEPAFRAQVAWLKRRLDELGPKLSAEGQRRCADHFGRVLALEIAFHDAPYAEG